MYQTRYPSIMIIVTDILPNFTTQQDRCNLKGLNIPIHCLKYPTDSFIFSTLSELIGTNFNLLKQQNFRLQKEFVEFQIAMLMCTVLHIFTQVLFWAGKQGNHQNSTHPFAILYIFDFSATQRLCFEPKSIDQGVKSQLYISAFI